MTEAELIAALDAAFKAGGDPQWIIVPVRRRVIRWRGRRFVLKAPLMRVSAFV